MRRYVGLPPKKVFAYPEISAEAAAKLDQPSFLYYLAKLPVNTFKNTCIVARTQRASSPISVLSAPRAPR